MIDWLKKKKQDSVTDRLPQGGEGRTGYYQHASPTGTGPQAQTTHEARGSDGDDSPQAVPSPPAVPLAPVRVNIPAQPAGMGAVETLLQLQKKVDTLATELEEIRKAMRKSEKTIRSLGKTVEGTEELLGKLESKLDSLGKMLPHLDEGFGSLKESVKADIAELRQMLAILTQIQVPLPIEQYKGGGD